MVKRTLYPGKALPIFSVAAFTTLAAFMFALTDSQDGQIGALVLLGGAILFAVELLPGAVYLKLTREGFEYKNILPAKFVKWSDVDHFTTYQAECNIRYVGWVYSDLASVDSSPSFFASGFLPRSASRFLRLSIDDGFSLNFDQQNAEALARLLEQWRKKYDDTTWVSIANTPK
jgi:hypothetical protein